MTTVVYVDAEECWITVLGECTLDPSDEPCAHVAQEVARNPNAEWIIDCSGAHVVSSCQPVIDAARRSLGPRGSIRVRAGRRHHPVDLTAIEL